MLIYGEDGPAKMYPSVDCHGHEGFVQVTRHVSRWMIYEVEVHV
jgi:hypothetical protein